MLILLSPHFTYFSRFIREDLYSLVFTLATILAFRMFLESDRPGWLILSSISFALAGVTKENAYMTGVLFVAFGLWTLGERIIATRSGGLSLAPMREAVGWIRERWQAVATAALIFLSIWVLFYTSFGRYPQDWLAIPKAVRYWMGQHAIARIPGPWYYYFPQLLYYETAITLAALFTWRSRSRVREPFFRFLVFWTLASLVIYGWAREKVPWLTVHPLLPITILAGIALADLWAQRRTSYARWSLAAIALLLAVNTSGMVLACFRYGAYDLEKQPKHGEYLAYVQTTWDLVRALDVVEKAKARVAPGQPVITVTGEATWPLSWYLRDTPTSWVPALETATTPIIVADWSPEGGLDKQLAEQYSGRRVPIRAWWFPDDFRKRTVPEWVRWWLFHELWSPIGSQDAMVYIRKDLDQATGPLAPIQISVRDAGGRDYPSDAKPLPAQVIGTEGSGPGQFNEPRGVATDGRGNIYVADTKNNRIQVFDGTGRFLSQFGTKGAGPGQFNEPCGIAVDPQGEIWVADTWNHRIVHLAADGRFVNAFGGQDTFFGPRAVLPLRGMIYVADTGNKRIAKYDRDGSKLSEFGGAGMRPGQLIEPVGLAGDATGNVYVADTGNHRIQVFNGEGKFLRQFPVFGWKDFYTEPYLAIGPSDTVLITDSWGSRIAQYDAAGTMRGSFRPETGGKLPSGITLDPFGRLIVADRGTHRLFSWSLISVLQ